MEVHIIICKPPHYIGDGGEPFVSLVFADLQKAREHAKRKTEDRPGYYYFVQSMEVFDPQ